VFGYSDKMGRLRTGMLADTIAIQGDPAADIKSTRNVVFVMKDGRVYK
jgi:imidazolonepropionase-like amidohydrolase